MIFLFFSLSLCPLFLHSYVSCFLFLSLSFVLTFSLFLFSFIPILVSVCFSLSFALTLSLSFFSPILVSFCFSLFRCYFLSPSFLFLCLSISSSLFLPNALFHFPFLFSCLLRILLFLNIEFKYRTKTISQSVLILNVYMCIYIDLSVCLSSFYLSVAS